jgi:hypothetical protein
VSATPESNAAPEAVGAPAPALTIHGSATSEEVAALVAVLSAASGGPVGSAAQGSRAGGWADHARALRHTLPHGSGAWRSSLR